jgi:hypothetical protein
MAGDLLEVPKTGTKKTARRLSAGGSRQQQSAKNQQACRRARQKFVLASLGFEFAPKTKK